MSPGIGVGVGLPFVHLHQRRVVYLLADDGSGGYKWSAQGAYGITEDGESWTWGTGGYGVDAGVRWLES